MAVSKHRKAHELERRREKLRLRAALANGEERMRLLEELKTLSTQIDKIREKG